MDKQIEAKFYEQEHRFIQVILNFTNRKKWERDDPRRVAVVKALVWRVLSPSTAAVAGGSLIAIGSLVVLVWQTALIAEQNQFFKEQNIKLQEQIDLQADQDRATRRTEVIANLYETVQGAEGLEPRANARTRGESVIEFVRLERIKLKSQKGRLPSYQREVNLSFARLDNLNLSGADLSEVIFAGAWLQNTGLSESDLSSSNFQAALMEGTSFRMADLSNSNFEGSNFINVSFAHSNLRNANFVSAGVRGAEFLGSDLRGADITGLREWKYGANFRHANIANIKGASQEFMTWAIDQGAVKMSTDKEWESYKDTLNLSTISSNNALQRTSR